MSLAVTTLAGLKQNVWDVDFYAWFRKQVTRMRRPVGSTAKLSQRYLKALRQ